MITPSFSLTATERVLPKLALDFTTASLDPRITFTRTTSASNPATYVNSTGYITEATDNQPRFDYSPITLLCNGLLIEESRQNLALNSNLFTSWFFSDASSVQSATEISPDGSTKAYKLIEGTSNAVHQINCASITYAASSYTGSIFLKAGERTWARVFLRSSADVFYGAYVNLETGAVGTTDANTSVSVTRFPNGWWRVAVTNTAAMAAGASATPFRVRVATSNGGQTYQGDGTSGIFVYGGQVELGAFATSYIPTTSAALTRNADVATITGSNFSDFWQATKGGVLVRARPGTVIGVRPWLQFDDGTANEIIALRGNTTNPELYIIDGGTPQAQIDAGTIAASTSYRLAGAWDTNNCAASLNGAAPVLDTSAAIPAVTQIRIGSDGTNYLNGHIESIEYYDQRLLDASMQVVSSPAGYQSIIGPVMRGTVIR